MQQSLRSKVVHGILWSLGQHWFNQGISLVVLLILARLLAPEDFGVVAIAGILIAILTLFVQQGFSTAIIQRKELEPGHLNAALWLNLLSGCGFALVGFLLAGPIASFYGAPELVWVIRLLSLNLIILSLSEVQYALLSKSFRFKKLAIRTFISTSAGGCVGVVLALNGFGVYSLVGQQLAERTVALAVLWASTSWVPGFAMEKRHLQDLWGFGLKVLGINVLNNLRQRVDVLILSVFFGPTVVGYYAIALKPIKSIVDAFVKVVSKVALPAFSALQNEPERLATSITLAIKCVAVFLLPVIAILYSYGEFLLVLLVGQSWRPSGEMLQILAFWLLAQALLVFLAQAIVARGRPGVVAAATGVFVVVSTVGMLLMVPFGPLAVIGVNVGATVLLTAGFFAVVKGMIGISLRALGSAVSAPILGVTGLSVVVKFVGVYASGMTAVTVGVVIGMAAYVAIVSMCEKVFIKESFLPFIKSRFLHRYAGPQTRLESLE